MDSSTGTNQHSNQSIDHVMIRSGIGMNEPHDRRSMIELGGQPLWEPGGQRSYRLPGSTEQLNSSIGSLNNPQQYNSSLHQSLYQANLPGNRHSYSGGPILIRQYGVPCDDQLSKSQYAPFTSPPFQQRKIVTTQRSFDSSSSSINQCTPQSSNQRRNQTRSLVLSAVNEDDMSSNHRRYNVVDQGPEMTDSISSSSPRESTNSNGGGGGGTPQLTPKHSARGGGGGGQILQPVPGQVLVDPSTGQHFIVPSSSTNPSIQPTPLYYQPLYYPSPPPSHPAYYPYPPMQGYPMAPLPQFSSRFAVPYVNGRGGSPYQQATCSTDDSRDEVHSSSSSQPPGSPLFTKHGGVTTFAAGYHQSRMNRDDIDGGDRGDRPSPPSSQPEDPEGPRDPFRRDLTRSSAEFRLLMNGGNGGTEWNSSQSNRYPSSPGSAPVLQQMDQSQPLWWSSRNRQLEGKNSFSSQNASLTDVESNRPSHYPSTVSSTTVSDSESSRHIPPPPNPFHNQSNPINKEQESAPPPPSVPKPKAIRMEIDLGRPMPEEEELKRAEEERNKIKANRAPPTAFTVSFGDEGEGGDGKEGGIKGKKGTISLQDAARRGRMARRSVGGSNNNVGRAQTSGGRPSQTSSTSNKHDNIDDKGFLLDRLLHGDKARPVTSNACTPSSSHIRTVKDSDNTSDAGTYVIGQSDVHQHSTMITSQIIERDSDESSTDTETTDSRSPSPIGRKSIPSSSSNQQSSANKVLLSELARMKEKIPQLPSPSNQSGGLSPRGSSTTSSSTPKARQTLMSSLPNRSVFGMAASSAGLCPRPSGLPSPSSSSSSTTTTQSTTPYHSIHPHSINHLPPSSSSHSHSSHHPSPSPSNNFRKTKWRCQSETRADGGRFSMRSGGGLNNGERGGNGSTNGSPQQPPKRPPFKVGGGRPLSSSNAEKQRETEMNAWLRRKDYNPMKAAMEAKKAAAVKNRSDQFVNNRSISFHVGPGGQNKQISQGSELTRVKSSESLHATAEDEARSHASQRKNKRKKLERRSSQVIAEYSRGVVEDISKLTKQHSKTKDQKAISGLAKVVDQLSTKCKKSIELIRAQNKGCLSVSVEDLLATAVEPPRDDESLTDQLDRLSNAFDAVQRYLEQYSLDDKADLTSDEESGFTSSGERRKGGPPSTFSSFSAYRQTKQNVPSNRSTFTSINNSRPARTTAYRAKLLATQHRSPSGGRPSKQN